VRRLGESRKSLTPPKVRHPTKPPTLRIGRPHRRSRAGRPPREPDEEHEADENGKADGHVTFDSRGAASVAEAASVGARDPGGGGGREVLDLRPAEGVVHEAEEGDGVAEELEEGDGGVPDYDGGDDEEDGFEDAGEGENERGGLADLHRSLVIVTPIWDWE